MRIISTDATMAWSVVLFAPLGAYAVESGGTPSIFDPVSTPAQEVVDYANLVLGICGVIFVIVASLLVISIVRFRARPGDEEREPPQVYGSPQMELAWTVVPMMIVFVLALVTTRTILALQKTERPAGWMQIDVVGHQWWWELQYPDYGFSTANELHLPLSEPTDPNPTFLTLQSQDVIHSFWVPQLSFKEDLIPNRTNQLWIDPTVAGVYLGQCAEFCGTQHAHMLLRVVVEPREDFERWAQAQRSPAIEDPSVALGRELFERTACVSCHRVRGTPAAGRFGPDLTHLMSRRTLGSGVAPNDRAHLVDWITNPDHLKPGVRMPAMQLRKTQIEQLVDYLVTLR